MGGTRKEDAFKREERKDNGGLNMGGEKTKRWRLEEFARVEEKKGKRVWVGNRRVKIDGYWWRWDEKEEVLRDGRGNMRGIEQGEGKEEEKGVIK